MYNISRMTKSVLNVRYIQHDVFYGSFNFLCMCLYINQHKVMMCDIMVYTLHNTVSLYFFKFIFTRSELASLALSLYVCGGV